VYPRCAYRSFLAFVPNNQISNLRMLNDQWNSAPPRLHHSFVFWAPQFENAFISRHWRVPFEFGYAIQTLEQSLLADGATRTPMKQLSAPGK
jgi:hypothetical protein